MKRQHWESQKAKLLILMRAFWLQREALFTQQVFPELWHPVQKAPSLSGHPMLLSPFKGTLIFHQDLVGEDTSLTLAAGPQRVTFNPHVLGLKNLGYLG